MRPCLADRQSGEGAGGERRAAFEDLPAGPSRPVRIVKTHLVSSLECFMCCLSAVTPAVSVLRSGGVEPPEGAGQYFRTDFAIPSALQPIEQHRHRAGCEVGGLVADTRQLWPHVVEVVEIVEGGDCDIVRYAHLVVVEGGEAATRHQ